MERDLLDALVSGRAQPQDPIGGHMSAPLPMVGSGEPVSQAVGALEQAGAALVLVDGKPAGMITRQDLLGFPGQQPLTRDAARPACVPAKRPSFRSVIRVTWLGSNDVRPDQS